MSIFAPKKLKSLLIVSILRLHSRTWLIVLLIIAGTGMVSSQEWNYARLALLYGGNIPFNFNSIKRFSEGVEILDGTILGVTLADSSQMGHDLTGFELNMRAFNGATEILGDVNTLDLNVLRIKAENYIGFGFDFTTDGYQDLASGWTRLCTYTDPNPVFTDITWDTHQLSISYECGKPVSEGGNGSLLGEAPDYYRVEVELELVPTGPGF